ncbi:hypothetical protein L6164_008926 [Bauhinia variegata]|uniref:Uncharacterized protein n=1 Tax=Bauhinia variegata TaxID=167791 RepID=A0ACB9PIA0_BAUVA|nr:hypothetical protein L6164_008926 [Bauhinia variegata]
MASTLSTFSAVLRIRSPSYATPSSYSTHSSTFSKPVHQFPFAPNTNLPHRATHLRPISAVEAPEKIEKLGSDISNLTLEEAKILVDYLQEKLGVSAAAFAPAAVAVAPAVLQLMPPQPLRNRPNLTSSLRTYPVTRGLQSSRL